MLRTTTAALAAVLATGVGASAQTAFPYWLGSAVVDSVSPQCANALIHANDVLESAYRAKTGISGEPNNPGINFYQARSTMAYFRTAGNATTMNGAGSGSAYLIRGNVTTLPNPSQGTFAFKFNFKVTPATITKTTQTVTVDGTITNWRAVTGCAVKFRAAYRLGNWQ